LIDTGLVLEMPIGVEAQIRSRSGIASTYGVIVHGAPCTIDSDYRGGISVMLINHGTDLFWIHDGDRIAQVVFAPTMDFSFLDATPFSLTRVEKIEDLSQTDRGPSGFGSTGKR
jgi:dUTP pyrophosphatase